MFYARVTGRSGVTNSSYSLLIDPPGNSPDDAYEPNDTPAAVDLRIPGGVNSPNLGPLAATRQIADLKLEDQADYYRFETLDYGTSHDFVRILFSHAQGDLNLHVYRANGTTLVGSGTSYGDNETVSLAGELPGVFYARVTGRSSDANSSYSLLIDPPGNSPDDPYEPNDTAAAVDLRIPGGVNSPNLGPLAAMRQIADLKLEDQADYYRFETLDYGTSHDFVRILFSHAQGDLNLYVYRADGTTLVGSGTSYSDHEVVSLAGELPGVFYARVTGRSGDANSTYSLVIDPPGNSPDDAYEPNDTPAAVDSRVSGGVHSPNLGLLTGTLQIADLKLEDQADYYRFETSDHGTSHDLVRILFSHAQGDLNLYVYRADGTTLVGSGTSYSDNEVVSLAGELPGVFYARVTGRSGDANSSYSLVIDPPGNSPDDPYEPNDTSAAVDLRVSGGVHSPNLGMLTATLQFADLKLEDQADYYRFETSDYGTSHDLVRILFSHAQGDLSLHVYRADGTSLVGSGMSYSDNEVVSLAGELPGVFYARVTGRSGDANSSYSLVIDPPGNSPDDAYEPNDTSTAVDLRVSGGVHSPNLGMLTATLQIADLKLEDQADYYRFETSDYGTSHDLVRILFSHAQGDLNLHVYRADGTSLVGSGTSYGDNETVSLAGEPPGVFYARVTGRSGDANSSYSLVIDPPGNSPDDPYEPNDTVDTVLQRTPGGYHSPNLGRIGSRVTLANLSLVDQADYYAFEMANYGGATDFVRLEFSHGAGDLDLRLYSEGATAPLRSSTSYSDNEQVSLDGLPPGRYVLAVVGRSGYANPHYHLTVQPPAPREPRADLFLSAPTPLVLQTWVAPGTTLNSNWRLVNQGDIPSGNFELSWYLSADDQVDPSDRRLDNRTVSLPAGDVVTTLDETVRIPADTVPGEYYLILWADSQAQVNERSETNNRLTARITVSAVPAPFSALHGTVYADRNANRLVDPGEAGLAGVTVYVDQNGNGRQDAGELTATTDADGRYEFAQLPPGWRTVQVADDSRRTLTFPDLPPEPGIFVIDSRGVLGNVDPGSGATRVIGATGRTFLDIAFDPWGRLFGVTSSQLYLIDPHDAAVQFVGSHAAYGANSLVFAPDGRLYAQSGSRLYRIDPRTAQTVEVAQLSGIQSGGDLAFHNGRLYVTTTNHQLVEIVLDSPVETRVVGPLGRVNVLGMVTGDDGLLYGLTENVVLHIDSASGATEPAAWFPGRGLTATYGAAVWNESMGTRANRRWTRTVAGESTVGVDFGAAPTSHVEGTLYHDANRNVVREPSEASLEGWYVFLDRNRDGIWQANEPRQNSSASGKFTFPGIAPGTHRLQIITPEGWDLTSSVDSYVDVAVTGDAATVTVAIGADRADPPRIVGLWPYPDRAVEASVGAIRIDFNQPMDPATLWPGSFVLRASGGDGSFHENNERTISIQRVDWDAALHRATLQIHGNLPRDHYQLRVRDLMIDSLGTRIDGEWLGTFPTGDLRPGGDGLFSFYVSNSPPEVSDQREAALQGVPLPLLLEANDPDGDALTFALVSGPAHGALNAEDASGRWTYTADSDYTGSDEFRFRVTDARGAAAEAVYQFRVARSPSDLTPLAIALHGAEVGGGTGVTPGIPFHVAWSVSNLGPGGTIDFSGRDWLDEVYLSADDILDSRDVRLLQWPVEAGAVAAGQTRLVAPDAPLVIDPNIHGDDANYLIVKVDARRQQTDANPANNVLAQRLVFQPGVQLTSPVTGQFVQRGGTLELQWRDFDPEHAGTLTFAIDTDSDPTNNAGAHILATGISEDDDQDRLTVAIPDLPPGTHYLWARLDNTQGTYYSPPLMVRVVDEALAGDEPLGDAVGGSAYEVFGVEAGRIGDEVQFRVRTNYNPRSRGGDVYLNLGGSFDRGNGRLAGIAVNTRTALNGAPLTAGSLYTGARFQRGLLLAQHPTFISDFAAEVTGRSAVRVIETPGSPWRYEIVGSFFLSDLGGRPGDSLQIGWAMYCGNDFGHAENEAGLPDLVGDGLAVVRDGVSDVRWGDSVTLRYAVANQGRDGGEAGASQMGIVLSPDAAIRGDEMLLTSVQIAALAPGARAEGTVTVTLPPTPPAGFPIKGPVYLALIQDLPDAIAEGDETNNRGRGEGTDVAVLQVGGPPRFVTVLTHGFKPPFSSFSGPGGFWSTWDGPFDNAVKQLAAQQGYAGDSVNYVTHWDSSEGWTDAIVSAIAYVALTANPNTAWLGPLAFGRIGPAMQRAERFAYQAAERIVEDLLNLPDHLARPEDGQEIHLIGHSRGAAVNAYASRLLERLQYPVAQYSALDGYSTDWPNVSGILGDISIVGWATAAQKTNYRVEGGLLDFEALGAWIDVIMWLRQPWLPRPSLSQSLGAMAAWRAPPRAAYGFDDQMVWGYGEHPRSNHMNVNELYFFSDAHPFSPVSHLRNSPLGRATPASPSTSADPGGSFPETEPSVGFQLDWALGTFGTFVDGTFEQLGELWRQTETLGSELEFDDPFLMSWWQMANQPQHLLSSVWTTSGDVALRMDADDAWVELTQGEDTAIGQYLVFGDAAESLFFDLNVLAAGPDDRLSVLLDDEEVYSVLLDSPDAAGIHQVPLQTFRGRAGELFFTLTGPLSAPARVELDDLRVVTPLSLDAVTLAPPSPAPDNPVVQIVASGLFDPQGIAHSVAFYMETNGIPGLQTGAQGDQLLSRDLDGSDGWTYDWDTRAFPGGAQTIYARAESDEAVSGQAIAVQTLLGDDALPFPWRNPARPEDVNHDGIVSALDALLVINHLNLTGTGPLPAPDPQFAPPPYLDVSGDNQVTPIDVLMVINEVNRLAVGNGTAEGEDAAGWEQLASAVWQEFGATPPHDAFPADPLRSLPRADASVVRAVPIFSQPPRMDERAAGPRPAATSDVSPSRHSFPDLETIDAALADLFGEPLGRPI
jgi:hypothetical protein